MVFAGFSFARITVLFATTAAIATALHTSGYLRGPLEESKPTLLAFVAGLLSAALLLGCRKAEPPRGARPPPPRPDDGCTTEPDAADDSPLRWSFIPSNGIKSPNTRKPVEYESELATMKCILMHRPTHDAAREAKGDYPYNWHFKGRARIWEVRVQVRFKRLPEGPLNFGLEMQHVAGHKMSFPVRQSQKVLISAAQSVMRADLYHTPGDDPAETEGEVEPPTLAMPLWAVDHFIISEPGEEPDVTGDLNGMGKLRTEGLNEYINAMQSMLSSLSRDKVYTFCFYGVSRLLDISNWELIISGYRMDANKLCGSSPVFCVLYEMAKGGPLDEKGRRKHLVSLKRYLFKVAIWSEKNSPPDPAILKRLGIGEPATPVVGPGSSPMGGSPSKKPWKRDSKPMRGLKGIVASLCSPAVRPTG